MSRSDDRPSVTLFFFWKMATLCFLIPIKGCILNKELETGQEEAYKLLFKLEIDDSTDIESILTGEAFKYTFKDKLEMTLKGIANFASKTVGYISYLSSINERLGAHFADRAVELAAKKIPNNVKLNDVDAKKVGKMFITYDLAGIEPDFPMTYDSFFLGLMNAYVEWANKTYNVKMLTYRTGKLSALGDFDKLFDIVKSNKVTITGKPTRMMHPYYVRGPVSKFVGLKDGRPVTIAVKVKDSVANSYKKPVISVAMMDLFRIKAKRYISDTTEYDLKAEAISKGLKILVNNIEYLGTLKDKASDDSDLKAIKEMVADIKTIINVGEDILKFVVISISTPVDVLEIAAKATKKK